MVDHRVSQFRNSFRYFYASPSQNTRSAIASLKDRRDPRAADPLETNLDPDRGIRRVYDGFDEIDPELLHRTARPARIAGVLIALELRELAVRACGDLKVERSRLLAPSAANRTFISASTSRLQRRSWRR